MKIALDIDGVILDYERCGRVYAELYDLLKLKKDGVKRKKEFAFYKRYDWTDEEKKYFIDNYFPYITYQTPFISGAREVLTLLRQAGFKIYLLTARGGLNKSMKEVVLKVLKDNNIIYDKIFFACDKKIEIMIREDIPLIIEDNPNIIKNIMKEKKCLYLKDTFSKKIRNKNVIEVSNWGEIARILINKDMKLKHIDEILPY